jgi:hypothetical protein
MRHRYLTAALLGLAALAAVGGAAAQQGPRPQPGQRPGTQQQQQQAGPSFTLRNEGSRTLREFYASSPNENDWGPDRLGSDMVAAGQNFRIQLPRGAGCVQDLRAVYEDDSSVERRGVDICRERTQAFRNAEPDTEVTVVNGHPRTLFQLYFRQGRGGDDWGPDRLGSGTVDAGERETIRFSAAGNCVFDIRVVFDNESAEERKGVNLCETPVVVFRPGWTTEERVPSDPGAPGAPAPQLRPGPGRPPGGSPSGRPAPAGGTTFRNQGTVPIVRLSIDAPGAQAAGPDRLGDAVIGPGGSLVLEAPQGLCIGDVVAVFRDGQSARRERVALCEGAEVSLP